MAKAKDNEKAFISLFNEKVEEITLENQKFFSIKDSRSRRLSSSVDHYFEREGYQVLIEIDSYNMAKVVVGQYQLLNLLRDDSLTNPIFLIVHTYSKYNPERTIKYLEYIKDNTFSGRAIPFGVIHLDKFKEWKGGNAQQFIDLFEVNT
ncbi:hypothetical protein [Photobacterium leiognathi]|uniref:hypothetical protein n=1 Tax=Photobacterium leiognathi TaxID=553611 RepID=UPI00298209CF|nr:hypothetical protein [Photobacterium leiognathi]